jgi:hypothetical protein
MCERGAPKGKALREGRVGNGDACEKLAEPQDILVIACDELSCRNVSHRAVAGQQLLRLTVSAINAPAGSDMQMLPPKSRCV